METLDIMKVSIVLPPIMEANDIKHKILKGAEELFMRYGIRSVSMDNIASHLGVSKKTLYQYFKDKDEMVYSVSEAHLLGDRQQFEEIASLAKNSVEELVLLSKCLRENIGQINPSMVFDLQKYHQQAWDLWLDYKDKFIRVSVESTLRRGIEEGYFRPEINPEILATLRLETIQISFNPFIFTKEKYSLQEVQLQIFEHFVHGLFTDKGKKLYEKYKKKNSTKEEQTFNSI